MRKRPTALRVSRLPEGQSRIERSVQPVDNWRPDGDVQPDGHGDADANPHTHRAATDDGPLSPDGGTGSVRGAMTEADRT